MAENNPNNGSTRMSRFHSDEPERPKRKNPILRIIKWIFLIVVLIVVSGVGLFAYYAKDAPSISQEQLESGGTSSFYTSDGKFLMSLGTQSRIYVKDKDIPQTLKDAIVSIEDKRFYSEKLGVDPIRIASSLVTNLRSNSIQAGGSTITQQLVKLTVFSTDSSQRTIERKAQEAWLAMKIEHEYTKNQILEFYINKVYMNYGGYGMATAARYYYGKNLKQLDLAQLALMAGMPNAPVKYNPYVAPDKAKYRRDLVLKAMYDNDKISKKQYLDAKNESITKGLKKQDASQESRLRRIDDAYIKEAISEVQADGYNPYNGNLKITLNIDQKAQNQLYNIVNNKVAFSSNKMQVGATVVDPNNGHVVAIIGGRHLPSVQLGLDRAVQTGRSTGSTIKPVLDYAPAIEYLNWGTNHTVQDTAYTYPGTNVQLYDWDNKYMGAMTMRYALVQSRNVPAVRTLSEVGLNRAKLFARKMDINIGSNAGLSVAIGANASSLQMASAYGAFATMGVYHKPRFVSKIETADGQVRNYDDKGTRVMKKSTAYMITDMLKGVLTSGTGTSARVSGLYEAGKTGTVKYSDDELVKYPSYSSNPKDSWFVGYTKQYSIGVWTGYDNLKDGTISGVGQYSAQLVYKNMMQYLMRNKKSSDWDMPSTVVRRRIASNSGSEISEKGYVWELFVKGHAPGDNDSNTTSSTDTTTANSESYSSAVVTSSSGNGNNDDDDDNTSSSSSKKDDNDDESSNDQDSSEDTDDDDDTLTRRNATSSSKTNTQTRNNTNTQNTVNKNRNTNTNANANNNNNDDDSDSDD